MANVTFPTMSPTRLFGRAGSAAQPLSGVQRVFGNFAQLLGGKTAAGVISAAYLVILTRALGAQGYGVLILLNTYVVLVGMIISYSGCQTVVRYGALALAEGDHRGFARMVRFMTIVEAVCGTAAILVAAALAPVVGPHMGWSPETVRFATFYSLAILSQMRATPHAVLQIAGRFDLIGAHELVLPVTRVLGALAVRACGGGLMDYLMVWLGASVLEGVAMWLMAWTTWRKLAPGEAMVGPWRGVVAQNPGLVKFSVITKLENTLHELAPKLAPLTVGWILGPAAAGVFSLALHGTSLLEKPAALLSRAVYPVLAAQNARREVSTLWRTVWRSVGIATAIGAPVVLLLGLFGPHLLPFVGGHTFKAGAALLVMIAVSRLATIAGAPIAAGLIALGKPERSMLVALAANVGLYPLLPLMIWKLGVDGAGWHALLQGVLATAFLGYFFFKDAAREGRIPQAAPIPAFG